MHRRARFHVHGLPDALRLAVDLLPHETALRRLVLDPYHDAVVPAFGERGREIEFERRIASRMLAEHLAVEPYGRGIIARAYNEVDMLSPPVSRHHHGAGVPRHLDVLPRHSGKRGGPRERYGDPHRELCFALLPALFFAGLGGIGREFPCAVQVHPVVAHESGRGCS